MAQKYKTYATKREAFWAYMKAQNDWRTYVLVGGVVLLLVLASCNSYRGILMKEPYHSDIGEGSWQEFAACVEDEFFMLGAKLKRKPRRGYAEFGYMTYGENWTDWIMTIEPLEVDDNAYRVEVRYAHDITSWTVETEMDWNYENLIWPCLEHTADHEQRTKESS